jgi:hypothetical protein
MAGVFQNNAFQNNAFQTIVAAVVSYLVSIARRRIR